MSGTIWHLTTRADWESALDTGSYTRSTRGHSLPEVGFIHASYPHQLADIAELLYTDGLDELVVLDLDFHALEAVGSMVVLEPGDPSDPDSAHYPHIYGPVPVSAVRRVLAGFAADGSFVVAGEVPHR